MAKLRTLRVYPNPYTFIDHEGRPAGAFAVDHVQEPDALAYVGVVGMTAKPIEIRDPKSRTKPDDRHSIHDRVRTFSGEVVTLLDGDGRSQAVSPHYRMGLREGAHVVTLEDGSRTIELPGSLVAADEETAKVAGLPFRDPIELLALARAHAIKQWTADHGEPPAFAGDPDAEAHLPDALKGIAPKASPVAFENTTTAETPIAKAATKYSGRVADVAAESDKS